MSNAYFKQTDPQYKLRWSEELREKIAQSAKEHNRSMNADIIARLEKSFETPYIDTVSDTLITELLEGTVNKLLGAIKTQGVSDEKIQDALKSLTNKKAP